MKFWKIPVGIVIAALALVSGQDVRAQQGCAALAETFDKEAVSSKGRQAPNLAQASRIKREGVELCATGREGDAEALLTAALTMIGVSMSESTASAGLADQSCAQLVETFDAEARGSAKTRNVPNVAQAQRIRSEGNTLCKAGQEAEANALLLAALRMIGTSDMPTNLQTVVTGGDCNALLGKLNEELRGGSSARKVPNAAQARQLGSLAREYCKAGDKERANEALVEAFRMIGRSAAL